MKAQSQCLAAYVDSQPGWRITATFTDDASGVHFRSATEPFDTTSATRTPRPRRWPRW